MARKTLVVFYSCTGTTRRIAEALSTALGCDCEAIVAAERYTGFFGVTRAAIEAMWQRPARIAPAKLDPAAYDLVILGTPVWAWSVTSPMRAYLTANQEKLPQVAFFCTLGGRGSDSAFAQMQAVAGKPPRATAAFTTADVMAARFQPRLAAFVQALAPTS
jgi:flavodoxin